MSKNTGQGKNVSNKAVKLALCIILAGVTSMSVTACGKSGGTQLTEENGVVSHEEEKLNELDSIVEEEDKKDEEVVVEEYDGNRYENQFLGLRLRYPENWFTSDSYDVLLNTMKDLGVNDKLDLATVKLNDLLNIVTFNSNDSYMNTIDIVAIPSLDKIAGDLTEADVTETGVTDDKKETTDTAEKDTSKDTSKDTNTAKPTDNKETVENKVDENGVKEIPNFTEADLKVIKESVLLSMGGDENVVSCEEPYIADIGGKEVAMIEFVSSVYSQEVSMVSAFLNLGENYLMITSASLNEPNDVDKIYNIEDILKTLELGFDLPELQVSPLAPIKEQSDEEVLEDLNSVVPDVEEPTSSTDN